MTAADIDAQVSIGESVAAHCKRQGLSLNQTRASVRAALNEYGHALLRANGSGLHVVVGQATAEGIRIADQLARGNHHG